MRRICVFCGASGGRAPVHLEAAHAAGRTLARRGLALVYGGGSVGLMGAVADGALDAGGEVIGVIPRALQLRELAHPRLTSLHVVRSMHERKAKMAELADGFVALPGGLGTLEELAEILTWAQLGLHRKPCGLLDVAGYYQPLIAFLDHAVAEGFLRPEHRGELHVASDLAALLDAFERYAPPPVERWIDDRTS
ncbi:LOG family protein [Anaeromyxobacter oryzisoli]|uniref:LOG family protein n=1 Tax=Anaeromyxobacter oryzisoli TaxID=2925408 RepID=UPI001F57CC3F|nr:TIGR00730 family Rossman fold protein [Anaeromyxobacter sp. SG63]